MRVQPENEVFDKAVTWGAPLLAFVIGFLRSLRDDKDFVASVVEGGLLGLAAFGVQPVFSYIGLPTNIAWVVAVWIGYVGVDVISRRLKKRTNQI